MKDFNNFIDSIKQETVTEEKTAKVARLVVTLNKIEKGLTEVEETLRNLINYQIKVNPGGELHNRLSERLHSTKNLKQKIVRAKLNLNFYML